MKDGNEGETGKCRWCDTPVIWAKHQRTEVPTPIDPEPVDGGNILTNAFLGTYRVATKAERESGKYAGLLRTNHWQTCPNAKDHKREK